MNTITLGRTEGDGTTYLQQRSVQIPLQETSYEIYEKKYRLKDAKGNYVDSGVDGTYQRVAKALASVEDEVNNFKYYELFLEALHNGASPAGRIMSNAGAQEHKPSTSLINCTVSGIIEDSMEGILTANLKAGLTLQAGCGIGFEFSTLRPSGSFVSGAGATTSGALSFMDIFDSTCFTVSSAGGRRGAMMGVMAVWHPDIYEFIKAKREDGRLRQFNLSLLIDDEFMNAVKKDLDYNLVFPVLPKEISLGLLDNGDKTVWKPLFSSTGTPLFWDVDYCIHMGYKLSADNTDILCKVYQTIKASELYDIVMRSTYDYADPGFLLIDTINFYNNNYFCEVIRATNPCGEQPLAPNGACLLGSINLALFVNHPFTPKATFDWEKYKTTIRLFSRMLDNVVELNSLPLQEQRDELLSKRRHGMGFLGLGSALTLLGMTYGSPESLEFAEEVTKVMAIEGYAEGIELAEEKGCAPLLQDLNNRKAWVNSNFLKKIWEVRPDLREKALRYGSRYTHAVSIAPTGTIALTVNNNVSNGIEPTFSHKYIRNVIREGMNSKEAVTVYSYEMLLYKHITGSDDIPSTFSTCDNVPPSSHVDIQSVVQKWCDSSISKTINVPTDTKFEDFKEIYMYAYDKGLKGCTTFRFNPETLQGVLVREDDLASTSYIFYLEDGSSIIVKGNEQIEYNGEIAQANNLYDAIKEGYYGKF